MSETQLQPVITQIGLQKLMKAHSDRKLLQLKYIQAGNGDSGEGAAGYTALATQEKLKKRDDLNNQKCKTKI